METDIHTHVVLVIAFIRKGSKFLLAQRSLTDAQAPGVWSLPGGKVDAEVGDSVIEDTLRREIAEEVGLEIVDKIYYLGSDAFIRGSGHHVVTMVFLCDWKSGVAKPLEDQAAVAWYTLSELQSLPLPDFMLRRITKLSSFLKKITR